MNKIERAFFSALGGGIIGGAIITILWCASLGNTFGIVTCLGAIGCGLYICRGVTQL